MSSRLDLMAGQFKEDRQQIVVAHLKYLTYNLNPIDLGHHCPDIFITFIFAHLILRVIIAFITDIYHCMCCHFQLGQLSSFYKTKYALKSFRTALTFLLA